MQNCDIYIKLFACCTCSDYASTIPLNLSLSFGFFESALENHSRSQKIHTIYDENVFNFQ